MKTDTAHYITIDGSQLPIIIAKNKRAKRLIIRYDNKLGAVKLTLPRSVSARHGLSFVESKSAWIAAQKKASHQAAIPFENGYIIPILGAEYQLKHVGGRGVVTIQNNLILVPSEASFMARRVRDFVKKIVRDEIEIIIANHTQKHIPVSLRETTSRWGSCSTSGRLSFCWRLAFAPYHVLEYVVCHELAHLTHHNHSKAYWKLLGEICSHVEQSERWLKENGSSLWRFGA